MNRFVRHMHLDAFTRLSKGTRAAAIAIVVIAMAAAMLMAPRRSSPAGDAASRGSHNVAVSLAGAGGTSAAESARATVPKAAPVTITGCLERNDERFRLKDTAGAGAPKARSWKTAFLKKGSASIEVVDAANRVKLRDHVGERITVTGTLIEREMQVRSLQRVSPSCKEL